MNSIFYGELNEHNIEKWDISDENPFNVLKDYNLTNIVTNDAVSYGNKCLRDSVYVDWGSIAWRATKEELTKYLRKLKIHTSVLKEFDDKKEYGVVFIEEYPQTY